MSQLLSTDIPVSWQVQAEKLGQVPFARCPVLWKRPVLTASHIPLHLVCLHRQTLSALTLIGLPCTVLLITWTP